jgi:hypothetical protein
MHMKRLILLTTIFSGAAFAQIQDAPPIDVNQLLQALKQIKEQNDSAAKTKRTGVYQQIVSAASSGDKAVAFWKEAVKAVQFEGAENEGAKKQDWREGDGEALNDRLCQNAVRLHLQWLGITMQHVAGVEVKQLLPQVMEHVKQATAEQSDAERFNEMYEKNKQRNDAGKGANRKTIEEDGNVKRVREQVIRMSVADSPVVRWLQARELVSEGNKQKEKGSSWEHTPGNIDGIYNAIILPEFRANKDPRLLEYWDMVIKREGERVAEKKLDMEQRDWRTIRLPKMQWSRAQDLLLIGSKNRAITDMFSIIKTYPQHPDVQSWITHLVSLLGANAAPIAPAPPQPTGSVPPPAQVPAAILAPATAK